MAQTKNLGKVTITPRGVYSPSSAYERLDAVTYDGSSWLALQNVTGLAPTPGQYWMLISAKGDKGDTGDVGGTITVDGVSEVGGNIQLNAVRYSAMSLSAANKKTARENIDAQEAMTIDTAMSDSSTNAVQNSTITDYIESSFSFLNNTKAPAIYDSVGPADIVTVSDGAGGMDASSVVVAFSPIQSGSGDPSPSNIRPISGRTGLTVTALGADLTDSLDIVTGYYDASGAAQSEAGMRRVDNYIPCIGGQKFYLREYARYSQSRIRVHEYDINKTWLRQVYVSDVVPTNTATEVSWTVSNDAAFLRFSLPYFYADSFCFAVYNATYPVSWQTEAGTVYEGTLDLVSGVLTVTYGMVDLGTLTWNDAYNSINGLRSASISDIKSPTSSAERRTGFMCESYKPAENVGFNDQFSDMAMCRYVQKVMIRNTSLTFNDFKTSVQGIMLVYELATPQTYQLTPQQIQMILGGNNIWSTGDTVELTYPCDTKLYIDEKTAALLAILSE